MGEVKTIDDVIREVKSQAELRTRYEGQPPRWDEMLVAELERLRAIVERLPKYADTGEPIGPGATIWHRDYRYPAVAELRGAPEKFPVHAIGWGMNVSGDDCYSTREAADAARTTEQTPQQ